jgi:hypothetical protein
MLVDEPCRGSRTHHPAPAERTSCQTIQHATPPTVEPASTTTAGLQAMAHSCAAAAVGLTVSSCRAAAVLKRCMYADHLLWQRHIIFIEVILKAIEEVRVD